MADEEKKEEGKEAEKKPEAPKKSNKMLFIILGVVGLLVLVGAIGATVMIMGSKPTDEGVSVDDAVSGDDGSGEEGGVSADDELEEGEEALGAIFPLDTFVVNLAGGGLVKAQVQVEFLDRDIPTRFYTHLTPVRDAVIGLLSNKRRDDVSTKKGKDDLKVEIRDTINDLTKKEFVKNVYFTQFLVQ